MKNSIIIPIAIHISKESALRAEYPDISAALIKRIHSERYVRTALELHIDGLMVHHIVIAAEDALAIIGGAQNSSAHWNWLNNYQFCVSSKTQGNVA